jgi:hypothetical protein
MLLLHASTVITCWFRKKPTRRKRWCVVGLQKRARKTNSGLPFRQSTDLIFFMYSTGRVFLTILVPDSWVLGRERKALSSAFQKVSFEFRKRNARDPFLFWSKKSTVQLMKCQLVQVSRACTWLFLPPMRLEIDNHFDQLGSISVLSKIWNACVRKSLRNFVRMNMFP